MSNAEKDELSPEEAREAIRSLKELRDHPGWHILCRIAKVQMDARINTLILTPRTDMKSEWEKEFSKGEVAGMKFILAIPESELDTLEAMKEEIDERTESADASSEDHPGHADDGDNFDTIQHALRAEFDSELFPGARTSTGIVHRHTRIQS